MKIEIDNGKESLTKVAKPFGQNGAHVLVPKSWIGKDVQIVLLEDDWLIFFFYQSHFF